MAVNIALADDHPLIRQGLRTLLSDEPDFKLVGEATDGIETVQAVERLRPDVLVLDLMMPGLNGLEVIRQVSRRSPGTRVLVLSMHAGEGYVLEALRCGAAGYVLKESSTEELIRAIKEVAEGRRYLSPPLTERAIEAYVAKTEGSLSDPYEALTDREREILHLAAESCSSSAIAERLSISPRTVETHRMNLMRKLGLKSQTELIRFALRRGIIPMES